MEQQSYSPDSLVGYSELMVIIMEVETRWIVICSDQPFFRSRHWDVNFSIVGTPHKTEVALL